jgi:hypothetical protein
VTYDVPRIRVFSAWWGKGERDFKLACAFNKSAGDHAKSKAELVKDICAMANNGAF